MWILVEGVACFVAGFLYGVYAFYCYVDHSDWDMD